jgi:hypothetical protein
MGQGVTSAKRSRIDSALDLMSQVHGLPRTMKAKVAIKESKLPASLGVTGSMAGALVRRQSGGDNQIYINPNLGRSAPLEHIFHHEMGHFIDYEVFSDGVGPIAGSAKSPDLKDLRKAFANSEGVKNLYREAARGNMSPGDLDYWADTHEVFARAYAQWVATRSKSPRLMGQLGVMQYQWTDADFAPIAHEFDRAFAKKGLYRGGLS